MNRWPHQERAIAETSVAIDGAEKACVTSPTGGGKTKMMLDVIDRSLERKRRVAIYTHRRMLLEQVLNVMEANGVGCGIRAAGYKPDNSKLVQVCSAQTEASRVLRRESSSLVPADVVIVDEAHVQAADEAAQLLDMHHKSGAALIGYSATPVDLAHIYDRLIVAGTNSELRACKALVPCTTYAPDEPDIRRLPKKVQIGVDLTEAENRKAIMVPQIFARVLKWYKEFNPEGKPAVLFGPDVRGSIWFAEQFCEAGIPAAHIDGENVSYGEVDENGDSIMSTSEQQRRDDILGGSRDGKIKVICNRFVLREAIDMPWIYHGIFATVFGALSSYLQAGGRLLRSHPSLDHVVLQDHGGNYWRHGSLNSDRTWDLTWTNHMLTGARMRKLMERRESEPMVCPKCATVRQDRRDCPKCGYVAGAKSRMVVQTDGSLREVRGDIVKPRRMASWSEHIERDWIRTYHRARSEKWNATFAEAEAVFAMEHNWLWPPRNLPFMPTDDIDWMRKTRDVPRERLNGSQNDQPEQRSFA